MIYFLIAAAFAKTQTFLDVERSVALKQVWPTQYAGEGWCGTLGVETEKLTVKNKQNATGCKRSCQTTSGCSAFAFKKKPTGINCFLYEKDTIELTTKDGWECYQRVEAKEVKVHTYKNQDWDDSESNYIKNGGIDTWCASESGDKAFGMNGGQPSVHQGDRKFCEKICDNSIDTCKGYSWKKEAPGRVKCMLFERDISEELTAKRPGWNGCMIKS